MKTNPESELQCKDCCWFELVYKEGSGKCHRYPPSQNLGSHDYGFSIVQPTDWCGEFEPVSNTDELRYLDASIPPKTPTKHG